MEFHFATILVFCLIGIAFVTVTLLLGKILRPHMPGADKASIYECGERPTGSPWIKFNIRFYVVALIFVVFDVEVVLLYPWATIYKEMGLIAFVYLLIFLVSLIEALVYVWKKGDLEWVKPKARRHEVDAPLPRAEHLPAAGGRG